jgi:hypothetical protein
MQFPYFLLAALYLPFAKRLKLAGASLEDDKDMLLCCHGDYSEGYA